MDKDILINIAKKSIERKFNNKINIDKKDLLKNNNFLNEKRASFVTLTLNKELRGCIGSLEANRTLFDDLVNNAYMAAFEDPRFLELSFEEFNKIEIEISILTPPIIVEYKDFEDLKNRLGNIFVGYTFDKKPIYARDLNAQGAMAILLKDAIRPNLVQTLEGNPAILHGGPFANIAQGTNTIIATKTGLSLADYVVTEAGFGADLGAEKFLHIKGYYSGLKPAAYVLVATIRALRYHGGAKKGEYENPNLQAVEKGIENLKKHIENAFKFGLKPIVAINHFATDSDEEINFVKSECEKLGVKAILADEFTKGGEGMTELAEEVVNCAANCGNNFKPLYKVEDSVEHKIETIAKEVYGADAVVFSQKALNQLKSIYNLGLDKLPICMAKTQKSLSDDEKKIGRPKDFKVTVREFEFAAGAGFIIPILGDMMRMPGLPSVPAAEGMDIDKFGKITGLS